MSFRDPNRLSFDGREFDNDDFSVDEWIQRKRFSVPLDVLRDDLGSHLKYLRSSLIELINQDYSQFVDLSSNLVGLDGKIQNITGPFTKVEKELQKLSENLSVSLTAMEHEISQLQHIRRVKTELRYFKAISTCLKSSEEYVHDIPDSIQSSQDFNNVAMACDEIGAVKFMLSKCSDSSMKAELEQHFNAVSSRFFGKLSNFLQIYSGLSSLTEDDEAVTTSLLRVYVDLGAESQAEEVFTEAIVKPLCGSILSKKGNAMSLLDEVEEFLAICAVIRMNKNLDEFPWMSGFDFVGRSVFPTIFATLSKHFPHIWSPAIPDVFHSNWRRCERFLDTIESSLASLEHLNRFREALAYTDFIAKWQFPVYFQLRFHNFAIELESALDTIDAPSASPEFKLEITRCTVKVIKQCWDPEKVYLSYLAGRFLKASALFVSRFLNAVTSELLEKKSTTEEVLVQLYWDLNFCELVIGQILTEKINAVITFDTEEEKQNACQGFLNDFAWNVTKETIQKRLISSIVEKAISGIGSVSEVPRLFRRTNREAPSKPSEYVETIFLPFETIKLLITKTQLNELWDFVSTESGNKIMASYQTQVEEVLTSVARMEESLKRLKKAKGHTQANAIDTQSSDAKPMTDDDKIRLQLRLDVEKFITKMRSLCPSVDTSRLSSTRDLTVSQRR